MDRNELKNLITSQMKELDKALVEITLLDDDVEKEWNTVKKLIVKWDKELQEGENLSPSDVESAIVSLKFIMPAVRTDHIRQKLMELLNVVTTKIKKFERSNDGSNARVSHFGSDPKKL